ncbi:hypothetical protein QEZ54_20720 [Catellatospora sp. KI3]|uniref:hypothetical protein n=1 Tax=Catellatospora sp. KI3 TaxID=3041620 RepID=UPI002482638E|nr:hypothetical protein [Catellatospora sp. KI3]MDI1463408.1 hypothetical protein [Catellatospora sp. KI3]
MKKRLISLALAAAATVGLAGPAAAAPGDTIVTLTVVGSGGLTISVPPASSLGTGNEGTTLSGPMGLVIVSDLRASLTPAWNASVVSGAFTTGSAGPGETIPAGNVKYWSGQATVTVGTGTFTPGQMNAGAAQVINVPRTAFSHAGGTGSNSATWNPNLVVTIPADAVGGIYTGTVTHSVV